jgi:hypothetical protein
MKKNSTCVSVDIRPLVSHIVLKDDTTLEIEINTCAGKIPRIADMLGDILGLGEKERTALLITKIADL